MCVSKLARHGVPYETATKMDDCFPISQYKTNIAIRIEILWLHRCLIAVITWFLSEWKNK